MADTSRRAVKISQIIRFRPVRLLVDNVGLFNEQFSLDFIDKGGTPTNLFLLAAPNGLGKTTLLTTFAAVFKCFVGFDGTFRQEDLNSGRGYAQLDIIADVKINDRTVRLGLSACCGRKYEPVDWSKIDLNPDLNDQIEEYSIIHFRHGSRLPEADDYGKALLGVLESSVDARPERLWDDQHILPTVLFFPATRRLIRPPEEDKALIPPPNLGYQPLQVFEDDGSNWANSLNNLLLWLEWMDDDRYQALQDLVEQSVLTDSKRPKELGSVNRATLTPRIFNKFGDSHRPDRLSHGERSLLQILTRMATHMTGETLVLIDELELHLHPNWAIGLLKTLKNIVATRSVSVIFTTHSPEIIRLFAHDEEEQFLQKGGHIISREELDA